MAGLQDCRKDREMNTRSTHFRGWAKPGPLPPLIETSPDVPPAETLDAISGHFRLFQLRDGHRFSTDDVLTAWYGSSWVPTAATVLDLGSGIGSAVWSAMTWQPSRAAHCNAASWMRLP